jgi:ATP-dependent Lon protease
MDEDYEYDYYITLAREGTLPPDFDQWSLADEDGWTVAHEAIKYRNLPTGFNRWDLLEKKGSPLARGQEGQSSLKTPFINDSGRIDDYLVYSKKTKEHMATAGWLEKAIENHGYATRELRLLPANWKDILQNMDAMFPNFKELSNILNMHWTLSSKGDGRLTMPAILLNGEPGIGKTAVIKWLAKQMDVPFLSIDMSVTQAVAKLAGSDRYWANAQPGEVFKLLVNNSIANPIILLDELDKAGSPTGQSSHNSINPLYSLLEEDSAKEYADSCVNDFTINASHINWICTSNDMSNMPKPIKSRITIIDIPVPDEKQLRVIVNNVYTQMLKDNSWGAGFDPSISDKVIDAMLFCSPREVKKILHRGLGSAAHAGRSSIMYKDIEDHIHVQQEHVMGFVI